MLIRGTVLLAMTVLAACSSGEAGEKPGGNALPPAASTQAASPENSSTLAHGPQKLWRFTPQDHISTRTTVSGGTAYVGTTEGAVYAVDAATGEQKWRFDAKGPVPKAPAVDAGMVYVAGGGRMYALDAATGKPKWDFATRPANNTQPGLAPAADDGTVYIADPEGVLHALDGTTGTNKWDFGTNGGGDVAVIDGMVYVSAGGKGGVMALDVSTHTYLWRIEDPAAVLPPTPGPGGKIYISSRDKIYVKERGHIDETAWETGIGFLSPTAVDDNGVYVVNMSAVMGLNAATGTTKWTFSPEDEPTGPIASVAGSIPQTADGTVYVTTSHSLVAIDTATGKQKWQTELGSKLKLHHTVADGFVYVSISSNTGSGPTSLVVIDAKTGKAPK
ncbi:PQQ-binding-like beta-propeller repeat protein [Kitasatospora sp. NPDC101235]|uniref:outer membrane protein assembly factor BamB family protein n=1 Tax=Kitasatospora sp. NPDC101235 TaxID=3364101 RepID=UPI00380E8BCE